MISLDSNAYANGTTGVTASAAQFDLILSDNTNSTLVASLVAGDTFYVSQMSLVGITGTAGTTFNGDLIVKNCGYGSTGYRPVFKMMVASKG